MHASHILEVGLDILRLDRLKLLSVHDVAHSAVAEVESSCFVLIKDVHCNADEDEVGNAEESFLFGYDFR